MWLRQKHFKMELAAVLSSTHGSVLLREKEKRKFGSKAKREVLGRVFKRGRKYTVQVVSQCSYKQKVGPTLACLPAYKLRCVPLFTTSWTVAHQAPLPMGFLRQEYWNGLPIPSAQDLPDLEIEPTSPASTGRFLTLSYQGSPRYMRTEPRKDRISVCGCVLVTQSHLTLCDPIVAYQAPLSMEFSRPEYQPGDLPNPGIEPGSHTL